MDITGLLNDHHVQSAPPGDTNYKEGWVNIQCPFCADHSYHLGINAQNGYANCWKCGWHPLDKVLVKVLSIPRQQVQQIIRQYKGRPRKVSEVKRQIRIKAHKLPTDVGPMKTRHKRYLEKREFDPGKLSTEWNLLGTGPMSMLDGVSYKHRILAPITWEGEQVTFQARDITDRHKLKYMACPEDRELIKHKHILYGRQQDWTDVGIAVEGITDVWRLGSAAFCTFGIDYTPRQVRCISKQFRRVIIIFDEDAQAQKQAEKLRADLLIRGIETIIETIEGDPAELSDKDAKNLIKKIY